ncbi:sensor histidine kinase [Vibrio vulnificus]|uniref:sensor histidine kinase n=1 Tax=Vibrio vulnificus TaxID=672 RepID=UPI0010239A0D|nr:ATP-binding protein [Vibrio vulnificus]RZQ18605.1 sensor histidine kinase [Vibrio vulnificus]
MEHGKYESLVLDSMHELRYFNQRLKNLSEQASKIVKPEKVDQNSPISLNTQISDQLRTVTEGILSLSQLFTTRLDFIEVELNPNAIEQMDVDTINIYGKFDKARRMLNALSREKRVKVCLEADRDVRRTFEAYTIIDILPYLILDNAVKYSPENMEVDIVFTYFDNATEVKVSSFGPTVEQSELDKLTLKHYRGENASLMKTCVGRGLGLYFVKYICDLHGIGLDIKSDEEKMRLDGIPHSSFNVTLSVPW